MHWSQNKLISNCFKVSYRSIYLHIFCKHTAIKHLISYQFSQKIVSKQPLILISNPFLEAPKNCKKSPCSLLLQEICQLTTSLLRTEWLCFWRTSNFLPWGGCLPTKNDAIYNYVYVYVICVFKNGWYFLWGILMLRHMYIGCSSVMLVDSQVVFWWYS